MVRAHCDSAARHAGDRGIISEPATRMVKPTPTRKLMQTTQNIQISKKQSKDTARKKSSTLSHTGWYLQRSPTGRETVTHNNKSVAHVTGAYHEYPTDTPITRHTPPRYHCLTVCDDCMNDILGFPSAPHHDSKAHIQMIYRNINQERAETHEQADSPCLIETRPWMINIQ